MPARQEPGWRTIAPRVLASTVGAYGLCYAWICAAVRLLPMDAVDANILATCLAFILFVAVILRAFAVRSVTRIWGELLVGTALPFALMLGVAR
ncbi:iron transporter [Sphingobium yanoikuyae]|uniref:Iron transporter n=1 Tax=Sphingobium yanoikuyae TaxID=13690 RepID=A0A291MZY8_SPHYA|nr:iron transporter [Sphingobium yanoikuyae]ATI80478.1 iron transporter [Sphingobium yanoikuyae]RSU56573.1 iron transporter [Sphingobium yanoikuyae]